MKVGRRLAIKLLNASKFVLATPVPYGPVTAAVDRGLLTNLARLVRDSTVDLDEYNYTRVLERTESFFWFFCDNYLELVKSRRYGDHGEGPAASANGALLIALSTMLRLFAPFLPFVTEEVWAWWRPGSIHQAAWPTEAELLELGGGEDDRGLSALLMAAEILGEIRKKKSEEHRGLKTPATRVVVSGSPGQLDLLGEIERDLCASGLIERLERAEAGALSVAVDLAPPDAA
jgi:valyl-tRNA synthetase